MIWPNTTASELAAIVSEALQDAGITAVLCGGAVVQIDSDGRYVSKDLAGLDFRLRDRIFIGTQDEVPSQPRLEAECCAAVISMPGNSTTGETA